MKIADLFEELAKKDFQNPDSSNLFFPAYIYCYDPTKEYEIRNEILELKDRLIRPDIYQECMIINIYEEFIDYLKTETLGDESLFDLYIQQEKDETPENMIQNLKENADKREFLHRIHEKIYRGQ